MTHLNLTVFARSWTRKIQYFVLVLAAVVATSGCPHWWASCVIRRDILWSCGSNAGCFVSYDTIALSIRPPTRIIPSSSIKGLSILKSSFLRRLCRLLCASLIRYFLLSSSSWVVSGPWLTSVSSWFLLAKNLFFNMTAHAITRTNFFQFEYAWTLMTPGVTTTARTFFVLLRSLSTSSGFASSSVWGHCSFGKPKNSGPVCHLPDNSETAMPHETSSATFCSQGICFH